MNLALLIASVPAVLIALVLYRLSMPALPENGDDDNWRAQTLG